MSHEALAVARGVRQQQLSEIETGKLNPTLLTLHGLAEALEAAFGDLVQGA